MEPKYLFIFMATTVYFGVSEAQQQMEHDVAQIFKKTNISKKIYCGRQLSSILSRVCEGRYNSFPKKMYSAHEDTGYPYRSRASATSLMTGFRRRRRRGVYNECCEKACSHEELLSYCAPPLENGETTTDGR